MARGGAGCTAPAIPPPLSSGDAIFQHVPGYLGAGAHSWRTTPVSTIQMGDWKLLEFLEDGHLELYHLHGDLSEQNNLASTQPAKAAAPRARPPAQAQAGVVAASAAQRP